MASNGFRTAQYCTVRIRRKREFHKLLILQQSATMRTNQKSTQSPTRNFTIAKKNDNFERRKIANPIPSWPTAIVQGGP
ncbi:hypothetical protein L596_025063 [Steinernema carpocapsae]|uniref:Uncharacterized protein n=1 Tax=Steinernema carpocapsae TaxID=34508 RepID=A0A4U5M6P2_STECR|nr:hypothetical protein L596_025063 [Steinernema carpocapsae]